MAKTDKWLLVDTETNGLTQPIHAVEIAAQLMVGWEPFGEPFRRLINVNAEIPSKVSRIHGYTKEILERDGFPPSDVYRDLFHYAKDAEVCSYNLQFDYTQVLLPEWGRLGLEKYLQPGFCLLRLTQRLLDTVSAGNHKLQTLRQFYRLPERGAHTALGDVNTVVDLLTHVLKPVALDRGVKTISQARSLSKEIWYPTRIPFGKYRGRPFHEARRDVDLKSWLEWLSHSENPSSQLMGRWYLEQLEKPEPVKNATNRIYVTATDSSQPSSKRGEARMGIVVYNDARLNQIKALLSAARERLADLEMALDRDRAGIAKTQSELFQILKDVYRKRDSLRLLVKYRQKYLNTILTTSDIDVDDVKADFERHQEKLDEDFDEAEKISEEAVSLSDDQQNELKDIYRKLVKLYHPDRVHGDDEKSKAYSALMAIINEAKAKMDIALLREISSDPAAFMAKYKLGDLGHDLESEINDLNSLYNALQEKILETISEIDDMRSGEQYELFKLTSRRPGYLVEVAEIYREQVIEECIRLEAEAVALKREIEDLEGEEVF
jgi:DNA polymerase III epsilon subunit-like protein